MYIGFDSLIVCGVFVGTRMEKVYATMAGKCMINAHKHHKDAMFNPGLYVRFPSRNPEKVMVFNLPSVVVFKSLSVAILKLDQSVLTCLMKKTRSLAK